MDIYISTFRDSIVLLGLVIRALRWIQGSGSRILPSLDSRTGEEIRLREAEPAARPRLPRGLRDPKRGAFSLSEFYIHTHTYIYIHMYLYVYMYIGAIANTRV